MRHIYSVNSIILDELKALQNEEKARTLRRFFKTGPGQYGEGDVFWGIPVPFCESLLQNIRICPWSRL